MEDDPVFASRFHAFRTHRLGHRGLLPLRDSWKEPDFFDVFISGLLVFPSRNSLAADSDSPSHGTTGKEKCVAEGIEFPGDSRYDGVESNSRFGCRIFFDTHSTLGTGSDISKAKEKIVSLFGDMKIS